MKIRKYENRVLWFSWWWGRGRWLPFGVFRRFPGTWWFRRTWRCFGRGLFGRRHQPSWSIYKSVRGFRRTLSRSFSGWKALQGIWIFDCPRSKFSRQAVHTPIFIVIMNYNRFLLLLLFYYFIILLFYYLILLFYKLILLYYYFIIIWIN